MICTHRTFSVLNNQNRELSRTIIELTTHEVVNQRVHSTVGITKPMRQQSEERHLVRLFHAEGVSEKHGNFFITHS